MLGAVGGIGAIATYPLTLLLSAVDASSTYLSGPPIDNCEASWLFDVRVIYMTGVVALHCHDTFWPARSTSAAL